MIYSAGVLLPLIYSIVTTDTSCDGNLYHIPTLTALLSGWNPDYEIIPYTSYYDLATYINHYARGLEMTGLPVSALLKILLPVSEASSALQSGKILNTLLPLITFLIGYSILPINGNTPTAGTSNYPIRQKIERIIAASIFSFNPIILAQSFTFYCDSLLYSEILLMAYAAYILITNNSTQKLQKYIPLFILFTATVLAISTKFTHFFYCGIMWAIILIYLLIKHRNIIPELTTVIAATVIALILIDYSPYITNFLHTGNPLYPLLGAEGFDIMTNNTNPIFYGHGRIYNLILSHFSTPDQPWALINDPIPLIRYPNEGLTIDAKTLPYGIFFPLMAIISLILIILSPKRGQLLIIVALLFCAPLLIEQSWWARYCPILWGIIPLGYLSALLPTKNWLPLKNVLRYTLLLFVIATWTITTIRIHTQHRLFDPTEYRIQLNEELPKYNHL